MLGVLLTLGFLGAVGAKAAYDNYDMKKYTSKYDDKGRLHYLDAQGKEYINGEKVVTLNRPDANGVNHVCTVGVKSQKIYDESLGRGTLQLLEYSEQNKQRELKYGYNSYEQYNPYFGEFVLTEISTGRTLTCVCHLHNCMTKEEVYRKWYFRPECQGKLDYKRTVMGDMGIEITKEEYYKLNPESLYCSNLPDDPDVIEKLSRYYEYRELRCKGK